MVMIVGVLLSAGIAAGADVTVSGSTTVEPLAERCAEQFNEQQTEIKVSVTNGGSAEGIKNVAEESSDIGMTSREVTPEEVVIYGDNFQGSIVAHDAVCIVVSKNVYEAGITELSQEDIIAIYNGNISNWMDLGGPDEEILVVTMTTGSGTRDTFNEFVMGSVDAETTGADMECYNNSEVMNTVNITDSAIAYIPMNFVQKGGLFPIAYEGVLPSVETIKDESYPLARSLHMYTWGEPDPDELAFLDFVLSEDGQSVAEELGFAPAN
jgi:phosphate transport system substrate-binding protein